MEINLTKVFERDIDLLVIDEFIANKDFAKIFTDKINIENYKITKFFHSLFDLKYGESDITLVIEDDNGIKYGILIEDKIDAVAMSNQSERYFKRGEKGIADKEFDLFHVFIIAPESYLKTNQEAKKYPNKISYEELLSFFEKQNEDRLNLKITLLKEALYKKKIGYQVIEDKNITNFWLNYYDYQEKYFPKLQLSKQLGPRGSLAIWPTFNTDCKKIKIYHKSNKGFIDLTFSNYGDKINELRKELNNLLDKDMVVVKTNKSAAIRIKVNPIDFNSDFELVKDDVKKAFETVERLDLLMNKINYLNLYEI